MDDRENHTLSSGTSPSPSIWKCPPPPGRGGGGLCLYIEDLYRNNICLYLYLRTYSYGTFFILSIYIHYVRPSLIPPSHLFRISKNQAEDQTGMKNFQNSRHVREGISNPVTLEAEWKLFIYS